MVFEQLLSCVDESSHEENSRVVQYVCSIVKNARRPIEGAELKYLRRFAFEQIGRITEEIPEAESYREKDEIFLYGDKLLMLCSLVCGGAEDLTDGETEIMQAFMSAAQSERTFENLIDETFRKKTVEFADVQKLIDEAEGITDEYRRGMLYKGLQEYSEKLKNLTGKAAEALAEFVAYDINRMVNECELNRDEVANLEFAADVCKHFASDSVLDALEGVLPLNLSNVNYYAVETLLKNGRQAPRETIKNLAQDTEYAELTHSLLNKCGKLDLFPPEYASPEYLAKSDMVHWLTYPTELNGKPDQIELLGKVKVKGEAYYVFKYKSDSDNLDDGRRNEWLIGWSNLGGGTFSNFDKLADYEKKTDEKTLKHIAKKLLK